MIPIYEGHELHPILEQFFAKGVKKLEVWEEKENGHYRFYGEFENTDRFRLSIGKKRHFIVKTGD